MSLQQIVEICLFRQRWTFLLTAVTTIVVVAVVTVTLPRIYEATATLIVSGDQVAEEGARFDDIEGLARTYAELLETPAIALAAAEKLPFAATPGDIEDQASFEAVAGTRLLRISAESESPQRAQAIANAYADALIEEQGRRTATSLDEGLQRLETRIRENVNEIRRLEGLDDPASVAELRIARNALEALVASYGTLADAVARRQGGPSIASRATVPRSPVKPRPLLYLFGGSILALLYGVGAAVLRETFGQRVASDEELMDIFGAPVLGRLPRAGDEATWQLDEAFQMLRSNVQFADASEHTRVIAVVSPQRGDGKSTVVVGLATAFGAAGLSAMAVDCDLRAPTLHRKFPGRRSPGVAETLAGGASGAGDPERFSEVVQATDRRNVALCAAGVASESPPALLTSDRLAGLLRNARSRSDYVVVDTPPVTVAADASLVAAMADGVLVVVDERRARRSTLTAAYEQIEKVHAPVLGVVVNRVDARSVPYGRTPYGPADGRWADDEVAAVRPAEPASER